MAVAMTTGCALKPILPSVGSPIHARTIQAEAAEFFRHWDANSDDILAAEEFPYARSIYDELVQRRGSPLDIKTFIAHYQEFQDLVQEKLSEPLGWFHLYDRNGNGRLDDHEIGQILGAVSILRQYDVNRDGQITREEVELMRLPPHRWRPMIRALRLAHDFERYDNDKSGALELKELGRDRYLIELLDANGDGKLQLSELLHVKSLWPEGPKALERYSLTLKFQRLDVTGRGRLTAEEMGRDARFAPFLDKDRNGFISPEEFMNLPQAYGTLLIPLARPNQPKGMDRQAEQVVDKQLP